MDRTTEDVATPVPPTIMEHYRDVHLDIDILQVNKIPFIFAKSRDIGFIHCKVMLSKHDNQVQNGIRLIILAIKGVKGYFCIWRWRFWAFSQMDET